jgi:manganese-dependent ADP-ribose/CDP-alcohol diphosphatase
MSTFTPQLSFGLIADLHYLDADNGTNFARTKTRRFRQSFAMLKEADTLFQSQQTDFNVQLGDMLDGSAKARGLRDSCLDDIFALTKPSRRPWYFLIGNHECYNYTREEMKDSFIPQSHQTSCSPSRLYYHFSPKPGFRAIVLDGYEVCTMNASTEDHKETAEKLILAKNHNYAAGSNNWFEGLAPELMRYVPFNGTIGQIQLAWLRDTLHAAERDQEKCIVFCHMPVFAAASQEQNVMWTCEEVLEVLHSVSAGTVMAWINGHDHDGGYAVDAKGIHHITPPAPIECDEGEVSYGTMTVHDDFSMSLDWVGKLPPCNVWPPRMMPPSPNSE